jgi:hypothetical protein
VSVVNSPFVIKFEPLKIGYDRTAPASKHKTNPSLTIAGEWVKIDIVYFLLSFSEASFLGYVDVFYFFGG